MYCIETKASALTRRSAGLPFMITGILTALPDGTFFAKAILDLQNIASMPMRHKEHHSDIPLPQVHALNCLRNVFTNTYLGPSTEIHLAKTLSIAVNCLENDL